MNVLYINISLLPLQRDFYEMFGCAKFIRRRGGASSQFTVTTTTARTIKQANTIGNVPELKPNQKDEPM